MGRSARRTGRSVRGAAHRLVQLEDAAQECEGGGGQRCAGEGEAARDQPRQLWKPAAAQDDTDPTVLHPGGSL